MKRFKANRASVLSITLALLFTITSCEKSLDINTDPNNASLEQGTPELVFPSAVASTSGMIGGQYAILGGIWAQYWAQSASASQYRTIDSYNLSQSDFARNFDEIFAGALNDYNFVINKSEELENWRFFLMGTVMKAYTYQVMVDLYDTLPYSEAFQGAENLAPTYEDGYAIYQGLLAELDNALSKDYTAGSSAGSTDVVFGGDINEWVNFANTLKLKMYLRMVYAQPAEAEAGIKELYSNNVSFLSKDASIAIFQDLPDKSNPFFEDNFRKLNTATNLRASVTFLSFLQANDDPRIAAYFSKATDGSDTYKGINQGDYTNPDQALLTVSVAAAKATDPVQFISAAESNLLQAEALERYYGGEGATEKYDAGVTAAFAQYGFESEASAFLADGGAYAYPSTGTFEEKLEQIIVQKWASFPGSHALEGFFEKNRTGYPKSSPVYSTDASYVAGEIVFPKTGVTGGKYPKRLIIPDSERKTNPNTPAVVPLTTNVWWDKK